jgi:branched-chain amino acid transport system permease protein
VTALAAKLALVVRSVWVPASLSAIVTGIVLISGAISGNAFSYRVATWLVYLVVVVGLYIFIGNSGVVSFGHISFMAIGAYSYALMTLPPLQKTFLLPKLPAFVRHLDVAPVPAALLAGAIAACFAALIGWPLVRLSGISASIALFAVLVVVRTVIAQAQNITRGEETMIGVPLTTTSYTALGWLVVAICGAYGFQQTSSALRLRCSREDEFGARAIGVSIARERMTALLPSAFVVGIGGALWAGLLGAITPEDFYIDMTFTTIVMLVIGGIRSLTGAVTGGIAVAVVSEVLRRLESGFHFGGVTVTAHPGLQLLGVSVMALIILILRPNGITGGAEIPLPSRGWYERLGRRRPR